MNRSILAVLCSAAVLSLAACGSSPSTRTPQPPLGEQVASANPQVMNTPTNAATNATSNAATNAATNATLQGFHWYLDKAEDAQGRALTQFKALEPKVPVRLDFNAGSKPGEQTVFSKVCNSMMTPYTLNGGKLEVGRVMSTMMGCMDQQLVQLEGAVGAQMERMQTVQIVQGAPQPRMVVGFSDGSRWHMRGEPTDATRYGSAGDTVFMEVAAQTKPCTSGVARTQCLQVREIRYDASSRKTVVSGWQNFHGKIQGFEFQPGVRHVLRLKRYTVKNPPADGSSVVYVMDMAVEVELVDRK